MKPMPIDKGDPAERVLDAIYDDVDSRLNLDGDCERCDGEDDDCPDCETVTCKRAKAVNEEIISRGDIYVAIAWLKSLGRWQEGFTVPQINNELGKIGAELAAATEPGE